MGGDLSPHACPRHRVEPGPCPCNLPKIPGSYMLPLPSQVMPVGEHRKILRQQQPSLTEYILIDLKPLSYHRFCLLLFLIDEWSWQRKENPLYLFSLMATLRYTRSLLPFPCHGLDVYSTRRSLDTHLYIIISMHSLQFLTF
jgi:hypothetical protein